MGAGEGPGTREAAPTCSPDPHGVLLFGGLYRGPGFLVVRQLEVDRGGSMHPNRIATWSELPALTPTYALVGEVDLVIIFGPQRPTARPSIQLRRVSRTISTPGP